MSRPNLIRAGTAWRRSVDGIRPAPGSVCELVDLMRKRGQGQDDAITAAASLMGVGLVRRAIAGLRSAEVSEARAPKGEGLRSDGPGGTL